MTRQCATVLTLLALLASAGSAAGAGQPERRTMVMVENVGRMDMRALTQVFEDYWRTFVDPNTGVIYECPYDAETIAKADHEVPEFRHTDPVAFKFPPDYARPDLGGWPTPEEVAASAPCVNGWFTPIENAASRGGMLLAGLAGGAFDLKPERRRACIDLLFKGLVGLWEAPGRTGFICRGFLPMSRAFYRQTSGDQLPLYLAGLLAYYDSKYCTPEHRKVIAEVFESVLSWLEEGNWLLRLHGARPPRPARVTDPAANARRLAMIAMAHHVTANPHWHDVYVKMRDEDNRKRFGYMTRRDKTWNMWDPWQTCLMYRILADLEDDPECRAFYREQRWLFMHMFAYFCNHPVTLRPRPPAGREVASYQPQPLPDWRPSLLKTVRKSGFRPERWQHWYAIRNNWVKPSPSRPRRPSDPALAHNAGVLGAYVYVLGAYRIIMADWPEKRPKWGADKIQQRLAHVFTYLDSRYPPPPYNLHVLASALAE